MGSRKLRANRKRRICGSPHRDMFTFIHISIGLTIHTHPKLLTTLIDRQIDIIIDKIYRILICHRCRFTYRS